MPLVGQGLLIFETSRSHSDKQHSVGFLWTSDRPNAETPTWQHTTFTTDRQPSPRRDPNPQSREESGRTPTLFIINTDLKVNTRNHSLLIHIYKISANKQTNTLHNHAVTYYHSGTQTLYQETQRLRSGFPDDPRIFLGLDSPSGPKPPHSWGFRIKLRNATLGRTPLYGWSARRRDLYLKMHNTHKRQISMPPGEIRTRNPSRRAAANTGLRPRGHWDRRIRKYLLQ